MSTWQLFLIAGLAAWVALCLIAARFCGMNDRPEPSDDDKLDSIRQELPQHIRGVRS